MNERIKSIAAAAATLFLQQGYAKTQISHIAKAVGISVGTIYHDFTGKKEIMHFVLKCIVDPDFADQDFEKPITDDLFSGLENEIVSLLEDTLADFSSHLADHAASYRFESLISDTFDLLSRYAEGCLFIEKNQYEFKYLARHYRKGRRRFLRIMTQYLMVFIENGAVRPLEHIELTAALIVELLSWWAMGIRYSSFETQDIPSDLAKSICMDNILAAYQISY